MYINHNFDAICPIQFPLTPANNSVGNFPRSSTVPLSGSGVKAECIALSIGSVRVQCVFAPAKQRACMPRRPLTYLSWDMPLSVLAVGPGWGRSARLKLVNGEFAKTGCQELSITVGRSRKARRWSRRIIVRGGTIGILDFILSVPPPPFKKKGVL
jgi:hypothetical protein